MECFILTLRDTEFLTEYHRLFKIVCSPFALFAHKLCALCAKKKHTNFTCEISGEF